MKPLALLLALAGSASADCPKHGEKYLDEVVAQMKDKSCDDAAAIATSCALGASGDVVIAGAATKVCTAAHAKSDKPLFEQLSKRCAKKYAGKDGTMYQSFAAFCQLDVAKLLAQLAARAD